MGRYTYNAEGRAAVKNLWESASAAGAARGVSEKYAFASFLNAAVDTDRAVAFTNFAELAGNGTSLSKAATRFTERWARAQAEIDLRALVTGAAAGAGAFGLTIRNFASV